MGPRLWRSVCRAEVLGAGLLRLVNLLRWPCAALWAWLAAALSALRQAALCCRCKAGGWCVCTHASCKLLGTCRGAWLEPCQGVCKLLPWLHARLAILG